MPEIVAATQAHVKGLEARVQASFKGVAVVDGDTVLGLAGYYPKEGRMIFASVISDAGKQCLKERRHLRVLLKAGRQVVDMANVHGAPLFSQADGGPGSHNLLRHLGFKPLVKEIYRWTP